MPPLYPHFGIIVAVNRTVLDKKNPENFDNENVGLNVGLKMEKVVLRTTRLSTMRTVLGLLILTGNI